MSLVALNTDPVLNTVGIHVLTWNIHNFTMLSWSFSHCPSVTCVSAANTVLNVQTFYQLIAAVVCIHANCVTG
jgi:hypothetical protein